MTLEEANAFAASVDAAPVLFRHHHLFADLLAAAAAAARSQGEVTELHEQPPRWLSVHGYPVEAIRHAQAAQDWGFAARLLADHWPGLHLDGQDATVHALAGPVPRRSARAADPELAAVAAADELARGLDEGGRNGTSGWPSEGSRASVPARPARRAGAGAAGMVRLLLADRTATFGGDRQHARQRLAEAPPHAPALSTRPAWATICAR